jgi:hypothetical protein
MEKVGQINISDSSIWHQVQRWGEAFRVLAERERIRANVLPGRWGEPSRKRTPKGRMGVAVDGTMIHILGEGWKELKVGSVFDVEQCRTLDRETGDREELAQAVNNSYVGYLGGPETFGQMIWAEAQRRGWEQARDTQALGDGAAWIWNLVADHFYDSHQMVDWYHGTEHLASLARLLKGDGTPAAKRWLNTQKTILYEGHALRLALHLSALAEERPELAADLEREAGYFHKHQRRMNYQQMREDGWAIGSGMVESAAKQFKARFTGPGMRWSRPGAERLIPVRAAVMSDRFEELWDTAYNSPPN